MNTSSSVRPIVLIGACLLTLLVGVFIGSKMADNGSVAAEASVAASNSESAGERGWGQSIRQERSEQAMSGMEVANAGSLSPQAVAIDQYLQMSQIDPLGAAQEALSATNNLERISKLALLLSQASSEDMAGIEELISSSSNDFERMQQMGMLYYAWGQVDAPAAVAYAEAQGGRRAEMATSVALSSWASLDPASARAWVEGSENPTRYQRGLLIGWSENNPLQALQYISEQSDESQLMNRWTAPQVANNLIKSRGEMAIDDLAAMPASRNRNELLKRLADELGETNPEGAASRLSSIDDPDILKTAVPEVAQEWAQNDPAAAVDFVNKYKENTDLYARAMAEVIEEWAERDPYEAGLYLNEQPASPELDRSVAEYSREAVKVDPEGAMSFAVSVNDDRLRTDTINRVARDWKRASPEAYAVWAEANPEIAPKQKN